MLLEKTDKADAVMLADLPSGSDLRCANCRTSRLALASLRGRRRQLVEMLVAEQNRLGQALASVSEISCSSHKYAPEQKGGRGDRFYGSEQGV